MMFDLVHYGHFTPEFVLKMKPFERDYHLQRAEEAKKAQDTFLAAIHDMKIER
jgi:hypothetical protein